MPSFSVRPTVLKTLFQPYLALGLFMGLSLTSAQAMDPSEWGSLQQGRVVVKQNMAPTNTLPSVEAKILVARPIDKVWPVVANPEKLMSEEQKVKKVRILSQEGNRQEVAFSVVMTHLLPTFNYVLEQNLHPPTSIRFHRLSGSFKEIQGFWRLISVDGGQKTVLVYNLKMDAGPWIPRSMLLTAVKADLPNMLQNAKRAIENAN